VTQYSDHDALVRLLERGARDAQRAEQTRLTVGAVIEDALRQHCTKAMFA
jgi:hypothetical protein